MQNKQGYFTQKMHNVIIINYFYTHVQMSLQLICAQRSGFLFKLVTKTPFTENWYLQKDKWWDTEVIENCLYRALAFSAYGHKKTCYLNEAPCEKTHWPGPG